MLYEKKFTYLLLLLIASCFLPADTGLADSDRVVIANFSEKLMDGWKEKVFAEKTDYVPLQLQSGKWVLSAASISSASGLFIEQNIDLNKTPMLHWSWNVLKLPEVTDEKTREGDDYGARIYVIFKTGPFFWQTRAINYVWSRNYPVGSSWPNAFTENAMMFAVESGESRKGEWVHEQRNVKKDIENLLGLAIDTIGGVAIMSDSDNSQDSAKALYGDIFFSSTDN